MNPISILHKVSLAAPTIGLNDTLMFSPDGEIITQPAPPKTSSIKKIIESTYSFFLRISHHKTESSVPLNQVIHTAEALHPTTATLERIFGAPRLQRNMDLVRFGTQNADPFKSRLVKEDFASLLFCLSLITKEDFEELLQEIQGAQEHVRYLQKEKQEELHIQFFGKTLETCSKEDLKCLEEILLPFQSLKDLFWTDPTHTQYDTQAPSSFCEMMERAAWARFLLRSHPLTEDEWEYTFAKGFSPPFLPQHAVIPHPDGYLYLSHVIDDGGACKRCFTPLGASTADPIILYRCTRGLMPTDTRMEAFVSLAENLRRSQSSLGCIKTYAQTKALLEDPAQRFIKTSGQQVRFIGYSQGGAHGQRDAVLFPNSVKKVTTVSSPGLDKPTAALFRKVILKKKTPLTIVHMRDSGDIAPFSGEEHLWSLENVFVTVKSFATIKPLCQDLAQKSVWWAAADVLHAIQQIKAFSQAHSRITVAAPYYKEQELPPNSKEALLFCQHDPSMIDPSWEFVRKIGCVFPSYDFASFAAKHQTYT